MNRDIRRLPDGELEVMQALWDCGGAAERSALEARLRAMAPTTLLTMLKRLSDKGFVAIEKRGRGSVYSPLVERHAYLAAQSGRFVRRLCGGDLQVFAAALCDSGLSEADLAELRRLLEEGAL